MSKQAGPKFADIPQFTDCGSYRVNVSWAFLEDQILSGIEIGLDLDPDFQRGYVWTTEQKIRYVEFILRGGKSGRDIYFNCVGWTKGCVGPYVIVDGKQRIDAVRRFMSNSIPAFGHYLNEYTDKIRLIGADFVWHVNNLPARADVLNWYIELNSGGTVHSEEELSLVRKLLEQELA